jgi:DNA-binding NtrC family response regulator
MRKQSETERTPAAVSSPSGRLTVLSLSPSEGDHLTLKAIIDHSTWMLLTARDLVSAEILLRHHDISVIICERDLAEGTWIDVLDHINALPDAPSLIVASRMADDHLWADVLNFGAWDVLAKPFDRKEVIRSVKSGWQHWHDLVHIRPKRMAVATSCFGNASPVSVGPALVAHAGGGLN